MSELAEFDGSCSEDGPILLAADGRVFNVAPARNFYGPGGEYAVMGGTDATRFLARNSVEPETDEERAQPLNLAERAALSAWLFSLQQKYDEVGRLATDDEVAAAAAAAARRSAYIDRMEELSAEYVDVEDERERLEAAYAATPTEDAAFDSIALPHEDDDLHGS